MFQVIGRYLLCLLVQFIQLIAKFYSVVKCLYASQILVITRCVELDQLEVVSERGYSIVLSALLEIYHRSLIYIAFLLLNEGLSDSA